MQAIDAAIQIPTTGNHNHLRFLIIEDRQTIIKIASLANQLWINTAGAIIIVLSDDTFLEKMYGDRGRIYSRQQAGAAIQTLLLKLTDLNIASCWVGAYDDHLLRLLLKIPQHVQIEALVPLGNERGHHKPSKKLSLEAALYWERWGNRKKPQLFKEPPERD